MPWGQGAGKCIQQTDCFQQGPNLRQRRLPKIDRTCLCKGPKGPSDRFKERRYQAWLEHVTHAAPHCPPNQAGTAMGGTCQLRKPEIAPRSSSIHAPLALVFCSLRYERRLMNQPQAICPRGGVLVFFSMNSRVSGHLHLWFEDASGARLRKTDPNPQPNKTTKQNRSTPSAN